MTSYVYSELYDSSFELRVENIKSFLQLSSSNSQTHTKTELVSLNVFVYHGIPQKYVNHICVRCYDLFPNILFYAMYNAVRHGVFTFPLPF